MPDLKEVVRGIAPALATVLGGPLAGGAVKVLAETLLGKSTGDPAADEAQVGAMLAGGMTPELQAKVMEAEREMQRALIDAGVQLEKIAAADRDSARRREIDAHDSWTPRILAAIVTCGFFGVLYWLLRWGKPDMGGDALLVMLGSLGTAWAAIIAYYFGSSAGSAQKTALLGRRPAG